MQRSRRLRKTRRAEQALRPIEEPDQVAVILTIHVVQAAAVRVRAVGREAWPRRRHDDEPCLSEAKFHHRCDELVEEFGLTQVAKTPGYALSGGERRRVEIARSLASEPRYMLLDEPFAGIDPIAVSELQHVVVRLKKKHIGVLITDHNVRETLQITDRAYIISQGRIFRHGTPSELASDPEVRKVYLGEHFKLH